MRISFSRKIGLAGRGTAPWISVVLVTTIVALVVTALLMSNLRSLVTMSATAKQAQTVATNGTEQWDSDAKVTTPAANFSTLGSSSLSISPLFTRAYQIYGSTSNSLGSPITTAFPTTHGWLQFFVNGALLLPASHSVQDQENASNDPLTSLINTGVLDATTGVLRLPLIQTLLTVGSKIPVGGTGSTLTYVDLRNATDPARMKFAASDRGIDSINSSVSGNSNNSNVKTSNRTYQPPINGATTAQGVFIQGGTRNGEPVGHLISTAFWNYINQPGISPHTWEKDFGLPLTEALPFTVSVNNQIHHMLIQVFSYEALTLDQDATQQLSSATLTGGTTDTTTQAVIQLLPTGLDYLRTEGLPHVTIQTQQSAWAQTDVTLLNAPGTGQALAHIGQNFPLTLLGDTNWVDGVLWYHAQWSAPHNSQRGWIPATVLSFTSPGDVPAAASFDMLSLDLSSYLNSLGINAGAVVYDLTRQRTYTYNNSIPFITASSMKVPIMLTFLNSIEQQQREPTGDEMNLLTTMIENSDNDSASALFGEVGGPAGISNYMQTIGVNGLSTNSDAWGYSTITPQAMVDMLTLLYRGKILNGDHRALALNLMENVESDQQVGVGDTAPSNAVVALKDGWVTGDDNLWAMNSSGIVTIGNEAYIISVYTQEQQALENGQDIVRKVCGTVASLLAA